LLESELLLAILLKRADGETWRPLAGLSLLV
jgi:hypothetical protein